eukprot:761516-Hanusia_phi.AAC.1
MQASLSLVLALIFTITLADAYVPLNDFEEVEIVPMVVLPVAALGKRQLPSMSRTQLLRAQMLCQDGMSDECRQFFEDSMQKAGEKYSDEGYGLGDLIRACSPCLVTVRLGQGYYADYADIDEDADVGVLNMPYPVKCISYRCMSSTLTEWQLNFDLIQSHKISISGTKPCGACSEEN